MYDKTRPAAPAYQSTNPARRRVGVCRARAELGDAIAAASQRVRVRTARRTQEAISRAAAAARRAEEAKSRAGAAARRAQAAIGRAVGVARVRHGAHGGRAWGLRGGLAGSAAEQI